MGFVVAIGFIAVLGSLAAAMIYMLKGGDRSKARSGRMVRALTVRIGLSILIFACILVGWKLGLIHPTGIPAGA